MNIQPTTTEKMSAGMKAATLLCSVVMVVVLFVPIWKIELSAPQYPEGLVLKIWANKLAGNVDVINGLNHYIGMRHLNADDFVEFTVLPFIIGGYAALGLLVFFLNRRKIFFAWVVLFLVIAVTSMVDFYRWEYDYGHELNPDAPIKVPGMAYQPPLIGYKKLLNFGAYSIPDIGGWIFIGVGVILVVTWWLNRKKAVVGVPVMGARALGLFALLLLASCSSGPEQIRYGKEACSFCKMTIVDPLYASQCISTKGKVFKFDDSHCLLSFLRNGGIWRNEVTGIYFSDFDGGKKWVGSAQALFLKSDKLHGPMGGTLAAFADSSKAEAMQLQLGGEKLTWQDIDPFR